MPIFQIEQRFLSSSPRSRVIQSHVYTWKVLYIIMPGERREKEEEAKEKKIRYMGC